MEVFRIKQSWNLQLLADFDQRRKCTWIVAYDEVRFPTNTSFHIMIETPALCAFTIPKKFEQLAK